MNHLKMRWKSETGLFIIDGISDGLTVPARKQGWVDAHINSGLVIGIDFINGFEFGVYMEFV